MTENRKPRLTSLLQPLLAKLTLLLIHNWRECFELSSLCSLTKLVPPNSAPFAPLLELQPSVTGDDSVHCVREQMWQMWASAPVSQAASPVQLNFTRNYWHWCLCTIKGADIYELLWKPEWARTFRPCDRLLTFRAGKTHWISCAPSAPHHTTGGYLFINWRKMSAQNIFYRLNTICFKSTEGPLRKANELELALSWIWWPKLLIFAWATGNLLSECCLERQRNVFGPLRNEPTVILEYWYLGILPQNPWCGFSARSGLSYGDLLPLKSSQYGCKLQEDIPGLYAFIARLSAQTEAVPRRPLIRVSKFGAPYPSREDVSECKKLFPKHGAVGNSPAGVRGGALPGIPHHAAASRVLHGPFLWRCQNHPRGCSWTCRVHRVEREKQADRVQLMLSRSTNADIGIHSIVQKCVIVALYIVFLLYVSIFFF